MKSKCSECGNLMEVEQEWIGSEMICPFCRKEIVIQLFDPDDSQEDTSVPQKKRLALILGIIACITGWLPIIGILFAVPGLILSRRRKDTAGLILNSIGLALAVIFMATGIFISVRVFS